MANDGYIKSRNELMIRAIIDGAPYSTDYIQSRNEKILQAIIDGTSYDEEPQSRIEALLLHILNGTTTDVVPLSRNEAILTAIANGTEYTEEPQSRMEELLIEWLESRQAVEKTASGAVASFTTVLAEPLIKCICAFMATQDLHGQSAPYPAGGGKNKFGVASDTYSNLSVTVQADGSVLINGTSDANHNFPVSVKVKAGTYVLSCNFSGTLPSTTTGRVTIYEGSTYVTGITNNATTTREVSVTFENDTTITCNVRVDGNFNYQNVVLYPQLELGSSASAFAPYENICPLVPVSSVDVTRTGKNLFDKSKMVISTQRFVKYGVDAYNDTLPNGKFRLNANQAYTFTFSGANSTNFESFSVYNEAGTRVSVTYNNNKSTFTPASTGAYFLVFVVSAGNWGGTWDNYDIQLELGNQSTDYEAYNGISDTVALGSSYYGGEVDVVSGEITQKRWFKQATWGDGTNATVLGDYTRKLFKFDTQGYNVYPQTAGFPQMCSVAPYLVNFNQDSLHFYCNANECVLFMPNDTPSNTVVQFSGELATAEQATTTDTATLNTLQGQNNVFNDTGNTEVTYLDKP